MATMRRAFGSVEMFATGQEEKRDNLILVARPRDGPWGPAPLDVPGPDGDRLRLASLFKYRCALADSAVIFTDEWHPVDWLDRANRLEWRRDAMEFMRRYGGL